MALCRFLLLPHCAYPFVRRWRPPPHGPIVSANQHQNAAGQHRRVEGGVSCDRLHSSRLDLEPGWRDNIPIQANVTNVSI